MIGYLGLARETFDVPFAMSKFLEGKKVLRNIFTEIKGIDYLITNNELSDKAFKYFKDNNFKKIIIFQNLLKSGKKFYLIRIRNLDLGTQEKGINLGRQLQYEKCIS